MSACPHTALIYVTSCSIITESQSSRHGAGLVQAPVSLMLQWCQRQQRDVGRLRTLELSPQQQVEGGVSILVSELLPSPLSCLMGQFLKIYPPKGEAELKVIFDWNHHKDQSWSGAGLAISYLMSEWYGDKGPAMEETLEAQVACEETSLVNSHCKELKEGRRQQLLPHIVPTDTCLYCC